MENREKNLSGKLFFVSYVEFGKAFRFVDIGNCSYFDVLGMHEQQPTFECRNEGTLEQVNDPEHVRPWPCAEGQVNESVDHNKSSHRRDYRPVSLKMSGEIRINLSDFRKCEPNNIWSKIYYKSYLFHCYKHLQMAVECGFWSS